MLRTFSAEVFGKLANVESRSYSKCDFNKLEFFWSFELGPSLCDFRLAEIARHARHNLPHSHKHIFPFYFFQRKVFV